MKNCVKSNEIRNKGKERETEKIKKRISQTVRQLVKTDERSERGRERNRVCLIDRVREREKESVCVWLIDRES